MDVAGPVLRGDVTLPAAWNKTFSGGGAFGGVVYAEAGPEAR